MVAYIARAESKKNEMPVIDGYNRNKAWALYTSVDIHNCNPEFIRDEETIRQYVLQLSGLLQLECYGDLRIQNFGSGNNCEGCSITQFYESSLVTGHFEYNPNTAYIDIFSSKYYNPEVISHFSLSFFKGSNYTLNVTVRK